MSQANQQRRAVFLVRHAKAGERRGWLDDDLNRPLSKEGLRQANKLGKRLSSHPVTVLLSSDYVRCIQTLEPLGERVSMPVEIDLRLKEDEPVAGLLDLIHDVPDGAVMCSHGDLIPAAVESLAASGMKIDAERDWRKASVWVIRRNKYGDAIGAAVWPPPGRDRKLVP